MLPKTFVLTATAMLAFFLAPTVSSADSKPAKLDLAEWQSMPVLHNGRIMPLQTFARSAAEIICGRETPRIDLKHELTDEQYQSPELATARKMFPLEKAQPIEASELLLSWLAEPEAWEHIPFLLAEHQDLRTLLDVPLTNEHGERLRYVSPDQLAGSEGFQAKLQALRAASDKARMDQSEFKPEGVDKLASSLWQSYRLWREIVADPVAGTQTRARFMQQATSALEHWGSLREGVDAFRQRDPEIGKLTDRINAASATIAQVAGQPEFSVAEIEPAVFEFATAARQMATTLQPYKQELLEKPPESFDGERLKSLQLTLAQVIDHAKKMAKHATEMHTSLYDDSDPIRVVPALNAAALDRDRDAADDTQPWLGLRAVLHGSNNLLGEYPESSLAAFRRWYVALAQAYTNRDNAQRAKEVTDAATMLSQSQRTLGTQVEPLRQKLDIQNADEALLHYTQFPPPDRTRVEVRYNQLDPFKWAWVISFVAFGCFCLAFGVLRKPMFWLGMLVLAGGMAWTIYGFYLRVVITRWAPVTNMYETVIYVPLFVSVLGAWFVLQPLLGEGLAAAWRLVAFPFTWEQTPLSAEQQQMLKPGLWPKLGLVLAPVRLALMAGVFWMLAVADYYDGGNTVLSLTPKLPLNQLVLNANALTVWLVGLVVLLLSAWFVPRVLLAIACSILTIPLSLRHHLGSKLNEVYGRKMFGLAATLVAFGGSFLAWYAPVLNGEFSPLQPVLRSNFWLTIHVLTIVSSYAAGLLAWGLGNIALGYYLFGTYRTAEPAKLPAGHVPSSGTGVRPALAARPPEACAALAGFCYKAVQVAVLLLAAGTILGGLWADVSWGRFWGWDPKEVFALVSLLVYIAILHGRYAGLVGNFGMAVGTILGATAIIMSWYGVNFVLGVGLHSYGFGEGGQVEVLLAVLANWIFMGAAALRYTLATQPASAKTLSASSA